MKIAQILGLALLPLAIARPVSEADLETRVASNAVVDNLMFGISLPSFESRRNAKNPSNVDWSSDNCSDSPDNPFGFNFVPACHRHDFGYQNFRLQKRFTESNKAKIDSNFKDDLYYQCSKEEHQSTCRGTANVYYEAVKKFGGDDATPGKLKVKARMEFDPEQ